MPIELLIALIPVLPLAGFLFAVLVGPRLDHVPLHGHHAGHETDDAHAGPDLHGAPDAHQAHGADHDTSAEADLAGIPTEEEQALTSPHAGHADDLANAEGAAGVIPAELNDGLGQAGHVTPGPAHRP